MSSSFLKMGLFVYICTVLLTGCFEERMELTLNPDGTGDIKLRVTFSEELVIAMTSDQGKVPIGSLPFGKDELLKSVEGVLQVDVLEEKELPDGAVSLTLEGTFDDANTFIASKFCRDNLKIKFKIENNGNWVLLSDSALSQKGNSAEISIEQMYGLAKGLYISQIIHLPGNIISHNAGKKVDDRTIHIESDFRNRAGFMKMKSMLETIDDGQLKVAFDPANIEFTLAEEIMLGYDKKVIKEKKEKADAAGLKAEIVYLETDKKIFVDPAKNTESRPVRLGVELTWDEGNKPNYYYPTIITSMSDNFGNEIVINSSSRTRREIREHSKSQSDTIYNIKPLPEARALKNITGHIEVVLDTQEIEISIKDIASKAGLETTGNKTLDELGIKVGMCDGNTVKLNGNIKDILKVVLVKDNGEEISQHGGLSSSDWSQYDFPMQIVNAEHCKITILKSEETVMVPFTLDEIRLP